MMNLASLVVEEEEEDFVLTDLDEDDDDDEDDDELLGLASLGEAIPPSSPGNHPTTTTTTEAASMPSPSPLLLENSDFYSQLEAELGSLLEEDLEAAVSTLLAGSSTLDPSSKQRTSLLQYTTIAYSKRIQSNVSQNCHGTSSRRDTSPSGGIATTLAIALSIAGPIVCSGRTSRTQGISRRIAPRLSSR